MMTDAKQMYPLRMILELELRYQTKETDKRIVADNLARNSPWLSAKRKPHSEITNAADLAGRAGADDDHVVVVHFGSSSPVCSRTMYSAYQSGQFGSACPVRASCCPCAAAARRSACDRSPADV